MIGREQDVTGAKGWLTSLARDTRGNTIAIVAASLIPLAGMVGGGVDISRMYIVKTRLQHACDAGALAGRKEMGGGTWAYNSYAARTQAEKFFDGNIQQTPYGATNVTRAYTEGAGKVSGVASATLPMTIMRVFGRTTETLSVTCDAEMRLPNTDVMFVLDVTGSMGDKAVATDTDTKIESLRTAVKCFYEIVARLDTNAVCQAGAPSGGTGDQVQIRFGFVPYNTNVNVGKLLPANYFANSWPYQSRQAINNVTTTTTYPTSTASAPSTSSTNGDWGVWNNTSTYIDWWSGCPAVPADTSTPTSSTVTSDPVINPTTGVKTWTVTTTTGTAETQYRTQYQGVANFRCMLQTRTRTTGTQSVVTYTAQPVTTNSYTFNRWRYAQITQDVSGLKDPSDPTKWNATGTFQSPIGNDGTNRTISWDGCIEERVTVKQSSYSPIPAAAKDLQIDLVPDQADPTTLWGPALPQMIYTRAATAYYVDWTSGWNTAAVETTTNYVNNSSYFCPTESRKMQTWPNATTFQSYVDGLTPIGNTYHDIGLIWGARLLSPTGIFRSENEYTPKGAEIERHMIFMTDGDTVASATNYAAYGLPWFDRRQTTSSSVPSADDLSNQVNARFSALCTAVKNKNITLWVISFGSGSNATTETRLSNCATPGRYFTARDSAALQQTFRSIADQISQLRLTK